MYDLLCLLILVLVIAAVIALEVWLSHRPSALPGLVMPVISLVVTVLAFAVMLFDTSTGEGADSASSGSLIVPVLLGLSTVILFVIYAVCRRAGKTARQVDKMNIQDL